MIDIKCFKSSIKIVNISKKIEKREQALRINFCNISFYYILIIINCNF